MVRGLQSTKHLRARGPKKSNRRIWFGLEDVASVCGLIGLALLVAQIVLLGLSTQVFPYTSVALHRYSTSFSGVCGRVCRLWAEWKDFRLLWPC